MHATEIIHLNLTLIISADITVPTGFALAFDCDGYQTAAPPYVTLCNRALPPAFPVNKTQVKFLPHSSITAACTIKPSPPCRGMEAGASRRERCPQCGRAERSPARARRLTADETLPRERNLPVPRRLLRFYVTCRAYMTALLMPCVSSRVHRRVPVPRCSRAMVNQQPPRACPAPRWWPGERGPCPEPSGGSLSPNMPTCEFWADTVCAGADLLAFSCQLLNWN